MICTIERRFLLAARGLIREDELEEGGYRAWATQNGGRDPRVRHQVRERPGGLGLGGSPHNAVEQPVNDNAAPRGDDGGAAGRAGGGDVGEQRGHPQLEPGAHLLIGGGEHGQERLPEDPCGRPGVLHPLQDAAGGVPGPLERLLEVVGGEVDRARGGEGERGEGEERGEAARAPAVGREVVRRMRRCGDREGGGGGRGGGSRRGGWSGGGREQAEPVAVETAEEEDASQHRGRWKGSRGRGGFSSSGGWER